MIDKDTTPSERLEGTQEGEDEVRLEDVPSQGRVRAQVMKSYLRHLMLLEEAKHIETKGA